METELSMGHGAERDKRTGRHFIAVFITIDTDHAAGPVGRSLGDCPCFDSKKKKKVIFLTVMNSGRFVMGQKSSCVLTKVVA